MVDINDIHAELNLGLTIMVCHGVSLLSQTEPQRFVMFSVQSLLIFLHGAIGIAQIRYHAYTCTSYFQYMYMYHQVSNRNGSIGHICVYHSNIRIYSNILREYSNTNFGIR